jgi:NADH-quinone oxidoreductase subunit H
MTTALMTSAVIPWGDHFIFLRISSCRQLTLMLLYFTFGVMSIGVYGIMIGGWASNNKFSLLVLCVLLKWYRMK